MSDGRRLRGEWHGFTLDTDPDLARAVFERRHGHPPAEVIRAGCVLLVGPISENGEGPTSTGPAQGAENGAPLARPTRRPPEGGGILAEQLALFTEVTT
jgi:hypothetical protein